MGTDGVDLPPWCQSRRGKTGRHRAAPLRSWPLGRRSGRVATEPYPPPRSSFIIGLPNDSSNDSGQSRSDPVVSRSDPVVSDPIVQDLQNDLRINPTLRSAALQKRHLVDGRTARPQGWPTGHRDGHPRPGSDEATGRSGVEWGHNEYRQLSYAHCFLFRSADAPAGPVDPGRMSGAARSMDMGGLCPSYSAVRANPSSSASHAADPRRSQVGACSR
jgi:hypothetical protein